MKIKSATSTCPSVETTAQRCASSEEFRFVYLTDYGLLWERPFTRGKANSKPPAWGGNRARVNLEDST